jgi:DNA-directed RNA polymerase specialized sigma24 family protein
MVAIMDDRWIDARARKLAYIWREPVEDCQQMLSVELLQGRSNRQAFLKVWNQLKRQAFRRGYELLEHPEHYDGSLSLEWSEFIEEVLNEREQWCLMMRLEDFKWKHIAGALGCSVATGERIYANAIKKLRRRLNETEDGSN